MIERRTVEGGMNQDDAPEFVKKGDYLVAHNCRVSKSRNGMGGAVKPLNSTVARMAGTTDTTSVIGAINDDPNQRVFFFRWSATNDHRIICWNRRTNAALTVLKQADVVDGLGFGQFSYITGVAIIGDYLYWCDGDTNQPRRVNVEKALRANNPSYTSPDGTSPTPYTLPLNPLDITVARRVPMYPIKARKLVSADEAGIDGRAINLVGQASFQFAYRYKHDTGEYTVLSPYSEVVPPNTTRYRFPLGSFNDERDYDAVHVVLDKDEPIDQSVQLVEVMVRRGNELSWNIVKTFDRRTDVALFEDHNTYGEPPLGFYFYNDLDGIPVADSESYQQFHDVPVYSNSLEIANNRLFMFNNVKGYDSVSSPITATARTLESPDPDTWVITGNYYLIEWQCGTGIAEKVVMRVRSCFGTSSGWYDTPYTSAQFYSGAMDFQPPAGEFTKYEIIDDEDVPTELIAFLNPTCQTYSVTPFSAFDPVVIDSGWDNFITVSRAFRQGYTYKVQTVFYDYAGRNAGVTHDPVEVTAPAAKHVQDTFMLGIDWALDQSPGNIPAWAHSYAIARSRVLEDFLAGYFFNPRYATKQSDGTYDPDDATYSSANDAIMFSFKRMVTQGFGYTYSEGDYLTVIDNLDEKYNLKIIGVQGDYILTELADLGDLTDSRFYFEIKYPRRQQEETFWEIGRNYKIDNPGKADRAFSVPSGTIYGDMFFGKRLDSPDAEQPVQCMNPNNTFWQTWPQDYGRVSKLLLSKQQRYETDLHPSGPFFPGTETNQLNAFLAGENKQLDLAIGFGQRLVLASRTQEYGTVMLAIGKSEAASIYIGRTEFYNADETPNVLRSTNVIGNVNILKGGFGTLNPESCFKNDGDVYWFSAIKSAFVRYAKDGVNPISDRKMSTFAAWLGNLVLTSASDIPGQPGIKVAGGFDDFHKEALWAIPPIGAWPVNYTTLDAVAEDLAITEASVGNMTAPIVPGEIHRFSMTFNAPVTVNVTVWDYHFGQKTFTTISASPSFLFVGRPGAPTTITVTTTPALNTILYDRRLERLRQYPYSVIDRVPKVIAFNEEDGDWSHTSSHTPEWFSRIGDQLVTFRAGVLYMHDATSVGTFYGVQYPAWVSMVFNEQPNIVKRLQGISLESDTKPSYVHIRTEEPFVQSSDLIASEIESEEGIFSSSVLRDRLSPNTPGTVTDKLIRGDEMRGRYTKILFEWTKSVNFAARIFNLISRLSGGNKT